ncbi:MAG: metal ABC transporter permease [Candidatus Sumerlaeota bacterium]
MDLMLYLPSIIAALLSGATAGLTGVMVNGLRMPFITVSSAHAAMAGAVFGLVLQERTGIALPSDLTAFIGALLGASMLAFILRKRRQDPNAALGAIFSLMLGLSFLGIGMLEGPKSAALSLLWGDPVFITRAQIITIAIIFFLLLAFLTLFNKQLKVLLFSRELAHALIPETLIFLLLLLLTSAVITINLQTVGGLLLFSLIANPSIAALKVARRYRSVLVWSGFFGALSAVGGFFVAFWLDLPAGACIVLFSSAIVGVVEIFRKSVKHGRSPKST